MRFKKFTKRRRKPREGSRQGKKEAAPDPSQDELASLSFLPKESPRSADLSFLAGILDGLGINPSPRVKAVIKSRVR